MIRLATKISAKDNVSQILSQSIFTISVQRRSEWSPFGEDNGQYDILKYRHREDRGVRVRFVNDVHRSVFWQEIPRLIQHIEVANDLEHRIDGPLEKERGEHRYGEQSHTRSLHRERLAGLRIAICNGICDNHGDDSTDNWRVLHVMPRVVITIRSM